MKKFIPILILLVTIIYGQNRFAQSSKNGGVQKNVVEKMRSTSNQNVPRRISYQGLITKADGSPTDDGSYEILFKIFETADGGESIWSENQEVTVNNGIISTILGNTNPFTVIPPEAFLELTVSGSTLSPRQVLTSVFYSVLSDTSGYARAADYGSLSNLPDLDVYVLKDSLSSYPTSADLYDTLSAYQTLDSNLTDLVEDGILSASKIEYGISSVGDSGQTWISDGDGAGKWGNPSSIAADDITIGDGNISIQTINGGVSIVPSNGHGIVLDSTLTIDGNLMGITNDTDLLTFSRDTLTVRGTVMASTIGGFAVLDEDDMASDSDVQLATQQSIKTYVDTKQDYNENLETIGSIEHVDGNFLVSNGSEWTVESDSLARASLGLGSIAMLDSDNMDINGGTIDGTIIGAENPQVGNFTTVQAQSRAYVGDMIIDSGSISTESGTVSFDDDIITTTGTLSSGSGSTIGNLTLADGSISSSSNQIDFGDDDLSTTGTLSTGIATLGSGSTIGNLTFTDGTIASESDNISFGSDNLSTNGTLTAGLSTLSSGSEIGDLTISNGSITSSSDAIDFGNDALSTTGTLSTGTATLATGSTVGNLTLADGSITSSSDAIDFGNDALSTTGTLSTGTATLATGSTVGNLTLADGSITSSSDAIDFGNNALTTSSNITANSFTGDGSNITGVEASSMGVLAGVSPIVLEGESINDFETILSVEDPTLSDKTITFPNATGTIITTGNDSAIDEVGTITAGQWQGTAIADAYIPDDITLSGGTIDNTVIGGTTPAAVTATTLTADTGFIPDESDGAYLGTSSAEFSDLFLADGAAINLGDEQDVILTHVEDTGIKLNGSSQFQFGDSGTQISQSADGVLDLVSDNEIEINGTTIDMNGAVDVSGAITAGSTITTTGSLLPSSVDGAGIGSSTAEFSDVFLADGGIINLGNNQDVTLTHIKDTGIKINDTNQLQFGDSGTHISQSADGVLDLVSDGEVEINGTTIDMNGVVDISGAVTTGSTITTTGSLLPASSDGAGIGSSTAEFSDVFLADGAVINLGDNQEVTLTHIEDEGLRLNGLSQMQFGDSGTKIYQSADGVLDLVSDSEVEINGTIIDINGDAILDNATVDFVKIDGTYVGHVDDTDLVNLANGTLTVSGTLAATTFSGDGSNLTGISASSIKADDLSQGDAAVTISTSSGAININPASGSPVLIDNTINIDGSLIGHADDTDLMTLTNGSVTFTGSTVIPVADVNGGAIDAVTLGTNSAVTQAVIDNVNINGVQIGHTDDTDLMTLADGSVTFTGSTVIPTANIGAATIDNINIDGALIGHTDDTDLITLADGSVTFTGSTVIPVADVNGGAIDAVTLGTNSAVTQAVIDNVNINGAQIGHTSDTDLLTLASGTVTVAGTVAATALTGDGSGLTGITASTISADDIAQGDAAVAITTSTGGVTITPAAGSDILLDGTINIDGSEIGHINDPDLITLANGTVTFTGSTVIPVVDVNGGAIDAVTLGTNSAVTQAVIDDVKINGATIGHTDDTDLMTLANGTLTVAGEISVTTLDIGGANVTSSAAEINYLDVSSLGTLEASKAVTVDANGDLIVPDGDKFEFGSESDMVLYHDGTDSYLNNKTGELKIGTATNGVAVKIGHTTSEVTVNDNLNVTGNTIVTGDLTVSGDDLVMGTNTSGAALIGDGTNYNPVVISGDVSIGTDGTVAIGSGVIVNADINGSAAIADSKLATISTADKVSGAAIQVDGATDGTSITIANTDKFLIDDNGSTKYVNATQLSTYTNSSLAADNITTGDAAVTVGTSSGNITLDGAGDIILDADDANVTIKDGGTTTLDIISNGATDVTFDAPGDIKIDAAGSDVFFLDGGTTFGAVNNNGGQLVLKSGSSSTTALTFSGANANIAGDLTITGDDLVMGTNTSGAALIGDGTNYNPVVISGDVTIDTDGTAAIGSGVIVNADINGSAAIADTKLATLTTTDKVSGAAIQMDGATDGTSITITDTDKLLIDDNGTTKYINASQLDTYANSDIAADNISIGDAAVTVSTSSGNITLDGPGDIILDGDGANVTIKDDGTTTLDIISNGTTDVTFDAPGDIIMDADGADIFLKDGGTTFGSVSQSGGELVLKSGSTPTTTATFSGADLSIAGDLTVSGDDLVMGTNTSGAALIGDGTNYNPVVISGDISIGTDGTAAIGSGVIVNADINGSAAIADSKLATISTADKVSAAALQVDGATDGTSITLADADKIIVDDAGATKYINASQISTYTAAATSTLTNKTLTTPKIADGGFIADANGNELVVFQTTGSAVNELEITNSSTGNPVLIRSTGGDSNIDITLTPAGTGKVNVSGDLQVIGDDLYMTTNTSGAALIGDGTNYNPVVISGDVSIGTDGTAAIGSGVIVNADINGLAAIVDSKLATISTADKVSGTAIQVDGAIDGTGITIADTDKFIIDDNGSTKYINASQLNTYTNASLAADNISTGDAAVTVGTSSGNITLDGPSDIILDGDGANVTIKDGGTTTLDIVSNGATDVTLDAPGDLIIDAGGANVTIKDGGTTTLDIVSNGATDVTLDAPGDIKIDTDGSDVFFLDGGTTYGSVSQSGGELVLKSGSSPTTAATFSGANLTIAGDLTVSGDDLVMGTNTSGAALIGDGTNYNPVVISGDLSIGTDGTAAIGSGVIVNADINGSAAIADSKLATISTADKVSGAAIQVDGATDGTGITIVNADKFLIDDNGTTKYVNASQFSTYIGSVTAVAADNITTGDAAVTVGTSSGNITLDGAGDIVLDADDANVTIKDDGTTTLDIVSNGATNVTFDAPGDIIMDTDGADIFLKDAGTTFGSITNSSGELVLKSGSSPTTAATFSGANLTIAGDLTISGDDLVMGTNTSGAALIGDGSRYNPVEISGDLSIGTDGTAAIGSGVIVNADINGSAAIADSKLATLSTTDKVSGAAVQVDGATDGTGITIVNSDKFLVDDGGTTKYINASQFATYFGSVASVAADNISTGDAAVTVGTSSGNVTLDAAGDIVLDADDANVTIKDDGTTTLDIVSNGATNVTFDAPGDIIMDADGEDIFLKDGGTTFGSITNSSGELVLKSGSTPTTAATFSGADLTIAGDLTISGDDLVMGTNTSGAALIGDGSRYNPVAISGDLTIGSNGVAAIESGVIVNADINGSAAIADSKLATLSTTDKVSAAAVQVDGATNGTGITLADADKIIVDDNGDTKYINASQINTYTAAATATLTNKTLTAPKIADAGYIADANGNELIIFQTTSSAVNELEITNGASGSPVTITSSGDDSDIDITMTPKGTGVVNISSGLKAAGFYDTNILLQSGTGSEDLTSTDKNLVWYSKEVQAADITLPQATSSNKGMVIKIIVGTANWAANAFKLGFANGSSTVMTGFIHLAAADGSEAVDGFQITPNAKSLTIDSDDPTAAGGAIGSTYTFTYLEQNLVHVEAFGVSTSGVPALDTGASLTAGI